MFLKNKIGFTLIELLIVIFVIVLISTLVTVSFLNIKRNNRDAKRVADIAEIQMALEDYKFFEGSYPETITPGEPLVGHVTGNLYMAQVPKNSDYFKMACSNTEYTYFYDPSSESYQISFCLEGDVDKYSGGEKCVMAWGILDYECVADTEGPFTLLYTAQSGGSIDGTLEQIVEKNQSGSTVTAIPNAGYNFVKWSDNVMTAARTDTNVTRNISVQAQFQIQTFNLTYAAGANGSISGNPSQTVNYGANGSAVTPVADPGYTFLKWSDDRTDNPRTDTSVTSNVSVTAQFQVQTFNLNYTAGTGGSISGNSSQTVNYGASGSAVTPVADPGYTFLKWSDDRTDNPRTDTSVTSNVSVSAVFEAQYHTLVYTAGEGGTIVGTTPQNVQEGDDGTQVVATPDPGYAFVRWDDDPLKPAARTDTNVTGDISATAIFEAVYYTLTYSAGAGGTILGSTTQSVQEGSNGTAVTPQANTGYSFLKWSDDSIQNPRTDTSVSSNISVTAIFEEIVYYNLTYTAGTGGSIIGNSPQFVQAGLSGTQVTASPNANYVFVKWSDNNYNPSRTDVANSNISVTAEFHYNLVTLAYTAGTGGTITGSSTQVITYLSNGTEVVASPNTGYVFVNWSDSITSASRTELNVEEDVSVTANFKTHLIPSISSPSNGSSHEKDASINFVGSASNTQGSYTCFWSSSIDGSMGSGCNINKSNLSTGNHTITLSVTDDLETRTTNISISVIQTTFEYAFTGAVQQFTVAVAGTYQFTVVGAKGGNDGSNNAGGAGGQAIGQRSLSVGDVLNIYVGGQGAVQSSVGQLGGWNGGGNAFSTLTSVQARRPGTGGGASDIRLNGTALANRIIVGAGGGGAGGRYAGRTGGAGGGTTGERAANNGGYGGTQSAGGASGGALGTGGTATSNMRGAGGGGYYGGGSSATDSTGGGGGSSYITGLSSSSTTQGVNSSGDGYITIQYLP
jgi:type II secretory pathway pseudopilin PulG